MTRVQTGMPRSRGWTNGVLAAPQRLGLARLGVARRRLGPEGAAFAGISLGALGLAALVSGSPGSIDGSYLGALPGRPGGLFRPFLGSVPPVAVVAATAAAGALALGLLRSRGWFRTYAPALGRRRYVVAAGLAALFGIEAIAADLLVARLPADANAPVPWSVPFYAVMGYIVEVGLGAVPLALVLGIAGPLVRRWAPGGRSSHGLLWSAMVLVSLPEAVFQGATSVPGGPLAAAGYIGLKVFAFNLVQLSLFRRYDFVTMYLFRLVYYVCWHVAWGQLRLELLF